MRTHKRLCYLSLPAPGRAARILERWRGAEYLGSIKVQKQFIPALRLGSGNWFAGVAQR